MRRVVFLGMACTLLAGCQRDVTPTPTPRAQPTSGIALLGDDPLARFSTGGNAAYGSLELVDLTGEPFARALRATVHTVPPNPWNLQSNAHTLSAVAEGDVIYVELQARTIESEEPGGLGSVGVVFELAREPWTQSLSLTFSVPTTWRQYRIPFASVGTYVSGEAQLNLVAGHRRQTVEFADIHVTNYQRTRSVEDLERDVFITYAGSNPSAAWRAAAAQRIEQQRKADITVVVTDALGNRIPGASVRCAMTRHAFGFGSAVTVGGIAGDSYSDSDRATYQEKIVENFNVATIENGLKWPHWDSWGEKELAEQSVDWLRGKGLRVRGHNIIWPGWDNLPDWLRNYESDPVALEAKIEEHIEEIAGRFAGKLEVWDVINEPYTNHDLMDILGQDVMATWISKTREADPFCRLAINEYDIVSRGGNSDRHDYYMQLIPHLRDTLGAPLDTIGIQAHFDYTLTGIPRCLEILDLFAGQGVDLEITEFDVDVEEEDVQADYTRDFMTACFSHPAVRSFVMWGFWAGAHWRPQAAMYRTDWSLRPNGQAYRDLVFDEWWTDVTGQTDTDGSYTTRGFKGDYHLTVTHGGVTAERNVTVDDATTVTIQVQ